MGVVVLDGSWADLRVAGAGAGEIVSRGSGDSGSRPPFMYSAVEVEIGVSWW